MPTGLPPTAPVAGAPAGLSMRNIGPTQASLGANVSYTIEFINNSAAAVPGAILSEDLIEGLMYVSSNPAARTGNGRLEWELGDVPAGEIRKVDVSFQVERGGMFNLCAKLRTADGKTGQSCARTTVVVPVLEVRVSPLGGYQTAVVGQNVTFEIQVTNRGTLPATKLIIRDDFDPGLKHEVPESSIVRDLGDLEPGESRAIHVTFQVVRAGKLCNRIEVSNAEGVRAGGQACITAVPPAPVPVQQPPILQPPTAQPPTASPAPNLAPLPTQPQPAQSQPAQSQPAQSQPVQPRPIQPPPIEPPPIRSAPANPPANAAVPSKAAVSLRVTGPANKEVGGLAEFMIEVLNTGEVPLTNVVVTDSFSPHLDPVQASEGYTWENNDMLWKAADPGGSNVPVFDINRQLASLGVGKSVRLQVNSKCLKVDPKACHQVIVTSREGATDRAEACVAIRAAAPQGVPAPPPQPGQLSISVTDLRDLVRVGRDVTYVITVSNDGKGPDRQISLVAILPSEVSLVEVGTTGPAKFDLDAQGRIVRFRPVADLPPGKTLTYRVTVRAEKPGEVTFKANVNSEGTRLLSGEATTTITAE